MTEEIQTSAKQPKNTVALIGMIFSIIWLILAITVVFFPFGLFFLAIWFILWLIGLFYKPRGKARIAIIIPVITFIAMLITWLWARKSIKTPAIEFANWANENITPRLNWDLDENKFQQILTDEVNKVISSKTNDELKSLYENSTWSNAIERFSYLFFDLTKQWIENALNTYENTENQLEIIDEDTIDEVDDIIDENSDNEEIREPENQNSESSQTFSDNEMNDIEDLINILE